MKKNKTVLYISYVNMHNFGSGSSVRPILMYKAFLQSGFEVIYIEKEASFANKKERIKDINRIKKWLDYNIPDFCYIESPGDPIILKEDRKLIKYIKRKNIKIAYFYRDAYYKVGKKFLYDNINFFSKKNIRYLIYKFLYWKDELLLRRYVDIVYFPSICMAKYFKFKNIGTLPPAGFITNCTYNVENKYLIYVGGISNRYGVHLLLDSLNIINKKQYIPLILVCREKEVKNIPSEYINVKWLRIVHASGQDQLISLYRQAKMALIPILPNEYNNFAVPVKLYEYMSYNLPIVSTNLTEVSKVIKKYDIGLVCTDDANEFAKSILTLYNDKNLLKKFSDNAKNALLLENLWLHRVSKIENDMNNLKGVIK
ncbi:MAG: glycosyltransferase [Bacilli bacterium]